MWRWGVSAITFAPGHRLRARRGRAHVPAAVALRAHVPRVPAPGRGPGGALAIHRGQCQVFAVGADGRGGPTPVFAPRELTVDEIRATVQDYAERHPQRPWPRASMGWRSTPPTGFSSTSSWRATPTGARTATAAAWRTAAAPVRGNGSGARRDPRRPGRSPSRPAVRPQRHRRHRPGGDSQAPGERLWPARNRHRVIPGHRHRHRGLSRRAFSQNEQNVNAPRPILFSTLPNCDMSRRSNFKVANGTEPQDKYRDTVKPVPDW